MFAATCDVLFPSFAGGGNAVIVAVQVAAEPVETLCFGGYGDKLCGSSGSRGHGGSRLGPAEMVDVEGENLTPTRGGRKSSGRVFTEREGTLCFLSSASTNFG